MAWISVHDHVIGGKLRELSKEIGCSQNEAIGILISLWLWGLNNADKDGELRRADKSDIAKVLSTGLCETLDSSDVVDALISTRWIDEQEDGRLYIHDWDIWQEQWFKFQSQKEYDAKRKREARAKQRQNPPVEKESPQDCPPDSPTDSPPDGEGQEEPEPPKPKAKKPEKTKYADTVRLYPEEYQKLCERFGEAFTKKCIEKLDLYKGSKGKTYKDDYKAILSWVVDQVNRDCPGLMKRQPAPQQEEGGNPFAQFKRGENP